MAPATPDSRPPPGEPPEGRERPASEGGERKPFLLRLPAPLMAELRGWAAQDLRSLNGHIEFLLRQAVAARKRTGRQPRS